MKKWLGQFMGIARKNHYLIVFTAEVFFLGVYLLWQASQNVPVEVPGFIYVNF